MKLSQLQITNFGCIDEQGYHIAIDRIVILIGPNNVGKSTVLRAYEAFASGGEELDVNNFYKQSVANKPAVVGVFSDINASDTDTIGKTYVFDDPDLGGCVKVKWEWAKPGQKGEKYSWDNVNQQWVKGGVGGWDSLFLSRIPIPLHISPGDSHEKQEATVREILTSSIKDELKKDDSKKAQLFTELEKLTAELNKTVEKELEEACQGITKELERTFKGHTVSFVPKPSSPDYEKLLAGDSYLAVSAPSQDAVRLASQGTGLQRAFLWSALAALANMGRLKRGKKTVPTEQPRLLLIDEPESFLHPPAIRAARDALYALAQNTNWQVLASTHSPLFVDVSKPHTTIVRVARGGIRTRCFSTDKANFSDDERTQLQMVRACHPTVNEFFFADHVILVEGETEHAVLSWLLAEGGSPGGKQAHVVNCLGKANLPMFCRILNQFKMPYTVIHDSDSPRNSNGKGNAMWTLNDRIHEAAIPAARRIAHVPHFEGHYFAQELSGNKPFRALQVLTDGNTTSPRIGELKALAQTAVAGGSPCEVADAAQVVERVKAWVAANNPQPNTKWSFD